MKLVFHPISSHPLAAAAVAVHVGWRHEPPSLLGISHFLEHIHYLGSVRYPDVDKETARCGTEIDGPTLAEATLFSFASLKEDFLRLLAVLLDMVYHPRFDGAAVERERQVVTGAVGRESDWTPWEWVRLKADDLVFKADELNSMGTEETLRAIRLEDLKEWQRRYYHEGNSHLLFAGDIEMDAIQDVLSEADIPSGEERPQLWRHEHKGRSYQEIREGIHPELYAAFRFDPSASLLPYELLAILLGNDANSLLFKRLRQENPLAYMVGSGLRLGSDAGRFGIYVGIAEAGHEEEVWMELYDLLTALKEDGPSEEELSWAKRVYRLNLSRKASDPERMLSFWIEGASWDAPSSLERKLTEIDREQIRPLCRELFLPRNCYIALVGPSGEIDIEQQWIEALAAWGALGSDQ